MSHLHSGEERSLKMSDHTPLLDSHKSTRILSKYLMIISMSGMPSEILDCLYWNIVVV